MQKIMGNLFSKKSTLTVEFASVKLNPDEPNGENYIIKSDYENDSRPFLFQLIKDERGNKLGVCQHSENTGKSMYFRVQPCADGRDWIIKAYNTEKLMWFVHQEQLKIQEYPNDNEWNNPPLAKFRFQFEQVVQNKSKETKYRIRNSDPGFKLGHNYLSFDQSSRETTFTTLKEDDPCQLWSLHFRLNNL